MCSAVLYCSNYFLPLSLETYTSILKNLQICLLVTIEISDFGNDLRTYYLSYIIKICFRYPDLLSEIFGKQLFCTKRNTKVNYY